MLCFCSQNAFSQTDSSLAKGDSMVWFTNLANESMKKQNHQKALVLSKKAFAFAQKFHEDHIHKCKGFFNAVLTLENAYNKLNLTSQALYISEKYLNYELLQNENTPLDSSARLNLLIALQRRSEALQELEDPATAEKILNQIIPIYKKEFGEDTIYANFLHSASTVKAKLGNLQKALGYGLAAREIMSKKYPEKTRLFYAISLNIATFYERMGDHKKARRTAYNIYLATLMDKEMNKQMAASALHTLANSLTWSTFEPNSVLEYPNTIWCFEEVIRLSKPHDNLQTSAYMNLGYVGRSGLYNRNQMSDEAIWKGIQLGILQLKSNLLGIDESKQMAYFNFYQSTFFDNFYHYAIRYSYDSVSSHLISKMYDLRLASKSTILYEFLAVKKAVLNSNKPELKADFEKFESLNLKINANKESSQAQEELFKQKEDLKTKISYESQTFREYEKKITWLDVQKKLKKNEAAIEIIAFDARIKKRYLALILLDHGSPILVNLSEHLDQIAQKYHQSIHQELVEGYNDFWKPLTPFLTQTKKVYISADGAYHLINLNSLQNPENKRFLGDDLEIILLNSTKDLLAEQRPKNSSKKAILYGNPAYNETILAINDQKADQNMNRGSICQEFNSLNNLPETQKEVEQIELLLKAKNYETEVFCKEKATEESLKKIKNPSILHIATHGAFCENKTESPFFNSFLALAGISTIKTGTNEGVFSAYEALDLDLKNTDLVVLSACETGKGKIENGEGVFGLQRAFALAGAKNVLMSLWKIDDLASKIIMTYFYEFYLIDKNPQQALKNAQQKFIQNHSDNPELWAAFVIWGKD